MLCNFARQFPPFAAGFLERARPLSRHFREETITDMLMASLLTLGGRFLIVEFPNEPITGADMQWDFVNPDRGTFFRLLIQAKRLFDTGPDWWKHSYKHLLHKSGGNLQVKTLCDTARSQPATYPLYAFYNPERSCTLAGQSGCVNVEGVNLAGGYFIEAMAINAKAWFTKTLCKQLGTLQPNLFSMTHLFCPMSVYEPGPMAFSGVGMGPFFVGMQGGKQAIGYPVPPRPEDIHSRLAGLHTAPDEPDWPSEPLFSDLPPLGTQIPDDVQERIARRRGREEWERPQPLPLWRITFISQESRTTGVPG